MLAGLIAVLLAGAIATAIVKNENETTPVVIGSPTPTQTYTYNGPLPTVPMESDTPIVPPSASPTRTVKGLPNTGSTSSFALALVMLTLALGGGLAVRRSAHGPR